MPLWVVWNFCGYSVNTFITKGKNYERTKSKSKVRPEFFVTRYSKNYNEGAEIDGKLGMLLLLKKIS